MLERIGNISLEVDFNKSRKGKYSSFKGGLYDNSTFDINDSISFSPASKFLSRANWILKEFHHSADDKIIVEFDDAFGGLKTTDNGSIKGFAIAGEDQIFHWAQAQIDGNTVVVSSSKVKKPVAVRYAWADNPKCNLINGAGLPAIPFRTDDWTNKKK